MALLAKGNLVIIGLTIFCIISNVFARSLEAKPATPFVVSANRVPVVGGVMHIYGHNFGSDASQIKVEIVDNSPNVDSEQELASTIDCTDVEIVAANRVIGCRVATTGTGKAKHISVSVTTTNADGTTTTLTNTDNNVAFSRGAPELSKLTYSLDKKTIELVGDNFGFNASQISVVLEGIEYPIISVDNNVITLKFLKKRRESDYIVPDSRVAHVTVDGQTNVANMTVFAASLVSPVDPQDPGAVDGSNTNDNKNDNGGKGKASVAAIVIGCTFGVAIVALVGFLFVARRTKKDDMKKHFLAYDNSKKPDSARVSMTDLHIALQEHESAVLSESSELQAAIALRKSQELARAQAQEATRAQAQELTRDLRVEDDDEEEEEITLKRSTPTSAAAISEVVSEEEEPEPEPEPAKLASDEEGDVLDHSLEEIDLRNDNNNSLKMSSLRMSQLYDKSPSAMSDSSFSESSDEEEDDGSSFGPEVSDASPARPPIKRERSRIQMSSEFPAPNAMRSASSRIDQSRFEHSPSPPLRIKSNALPQSSLRSSLIPPPLTLSPGDSSDDGSPLPSPRNVSPGSKKGKAKKGIAMMRVPSSRLAKSAIIQRDEEDTFDSPHL